MTYLTRPLVPADIPEAAAVLASGFQVWPPAGAGDEVAHLAWLVEEADPVRGSATVVTDGLRIIGVSTRMERDVIIRGDRRRGRVSTYVALLPEYRGRGIWSATRESRRESRTTPDSDVSISFSNVPQLRGDRPPRAGRARVEPALQVLAAALRPSLQPRELALGLASTARLWSARLRRPWAGASVISVQQVDSFDSRVDGLTRSASAQFDVLFSRDHEFMNWRFCDARGGKFTSFTAERGGQLVGLLVLLEDRPRSSIVDLLIDPAAPEAIRALVRDAKSRSRRAGARSIECLLTAVHPYREQLAREGFVAARSRTAETRNMARVSSHDHLELDALDRIHITMGDSDLF